MINPIFSTWQGGIAEGALFIFLGCVAIFLPFFTTWSVAAILGVVVMISAIGFISRSRAAEGSTDYFSLTAAIVIALLGFFMVVSPAFGVGAITGLVAIYLAIDGVGRLVATTRLPSSTRSSWLLASGIVALLLALMIFAGWPTMSGTVVGTLLGLYLLFSGIALVIVGVRFRNTDGSSSVENEER